MGTFNVRVPRNWVGATGRFMTTDAMDQYQHHGRKLIQVASLALLAPSLTCLQLIFKSTDSRGAKEPPGPRLPPTAKPSQPMARDIRLSPLASDVRLEEGPQLALLKAAALKKQKRPPARIPPLGDLRPPPSSNQESVGELAPLESSPTDALLLADDASSITITIDEVAATPAWRSPAMDKVIGDLKSWRAEHAKKITAQLEGDVGPKVQLDDDPVAGDDEEPDAYDTELQALYAVTGLGWMSLLNAHAKARWGTMGHRQKVPPAPAPTLPLASEAKVQKLLSTDNVGQLQQLRNEVFELRVRDLTRQWTESINNDPEEAAFEANLLELECGMPPARPEYSSFWD
ncbi:hypothetical protein ACHHYP_02219 [Achlya hypogyna]|uniref:Uncharacterized protein n=1 Tax=Achlya hypogyna TaxID=1202772 RepID=A0A1V9ZSA8_ACHHY|nr:hypothetical protein ACHHYP_02219 [Achlya hypogyna]